MGTRELCHRQCGLNFSKNGRYVSIPLFKKNNRVKIISRLSYKRVRKGSNRPLNAVSLELQGQNARNDSQRRKD